MDRLLRAMAIFIAYPFLAAAIGGFLLVLGRRRHRRTAIGAGIVWLLYFAYETGMLIYPLLLILLVAAAVSLSRAPRLKQSD